MWFWWEGSGGCSGRVQRFVISPPAPTSSAVVAFWRDCLVWFWFISFSPFSQTLSYFYLFLPQGDKLILLNIAWPVYASFSYRISHQESWSPLVPALGKHNSAPLGFVNTHIPHGKYSSAPSFPSFLTSIAPSVSFQIWAEFQQYWCVLAARNKPWKEI